MPLPFPYEALTALFPFYCVFDQRLIVESTGPALRRFMPSLTVGGAFGDGFTIERPSVGLTFGELLAHDSSLFVLRSTAGVRFKGQMYPLGPARIAFLGSPRPDSLEEMRQLGLSGADYAPHDDVVDHLLALHALRTTLAEADRLASSLVHERHLLHDMQRKLRESNVALEGAVAMKDAVAAALSHELRTPLHSILGCAELMLSREELPSSLSLLVQTIAGCANHLNALASDLLDTYSPLQAGVREEISVDELARRALLLVSTLSLKRGVTLSNSVSAPDQRLSVDSRRIVQVLVNLLSNAIEHTPPGGQVTFVASCTSDEATFDIHDSGFGISDDLRDRIFDRFVSVTADANPGRTGIGLGLFLARQFARAHDGDVVLLRTSATGSVFRLRIPRSSTASNR